MRYFIDRKKNVEKIYFMDTQCEICMKDVQKPAPFDDCDDCHIFKKGGCKYKEIYTGKIGMSFLEFISLDFDNIIKELIELFYQVKDKGMDYAVNAADEYLKDKNIYLQILDVCDKFRYLTNPKYNRPDFATPEFEISALFDEVIILQKIISAYADDKYFVEPDILLQAINEYHLTLIPSLYTPDCYDAFAPFQENPIGMIKSFAEECKKMRSNTYELSVFYNSFGIALEWIVNNNYKISRCENCGKFFVPYGRYDTRYCPYPQSNGKSCRELSFEITMKNNKVMKEYRKIYKTKHAWMNRNKATQPMAEGEFKRWHKYAKRMVDKYKMGAVSEMECLKWLEENK